MSKKYHIYKMFNNDNNLLYIGKTHIKNPKDKIINKLDMRNLMN